MLSRPIPELPLRPERKDVYKRQVEIRCELKKEGDFSGTLYTIRYFQFEGDGSLKMDNGITFLPNDRYLLENEKFRLDVYKRQGFERRGVYRIPLHRHHRLLYHSHRCGLDYPSRMSGEDASLK